MNEKCHKFSFQFLLILFFNFFLHNIFSQIFFQISYTFRRIYQIFTLFSPKKERKQLTIGGLIKSYGSDSERTKLVKVHPLLPLTLFLLFFSKIYREETSIRYENLAQTFANNSNEIKKEFN